MTEKQPKEDASGTQLPVEKTGNKDVQQLQELYDLMQKEGLDSIELKDNETRIRLTRHVEAPWQGHFIPIPRNSSNESPSANGSPSSAPAENDNLETIASPLAGVFYRASSPTSAPYVKEGDIVENGQTLCIVEAMKVMNEIKAEKRCRIARIPAENSRPVTAGQPLFMVEPA
ncbi:MAG: acetyl-CoA carboxylase biotin carboxyl carrier protein subunit [Elusimicrobiota bacterium]|jgi:acetyl-CoA carboxylase biotin carboxyl carrier protein